MVISRPGRHGVCSIQLAWKSAEGALAAAPLIPGASGNNLHLYGCLPGSPQTKWKNIFSARKEKSKFLFPGDEFVDGPPDHSRKKWGTAVTESVTDLCRGKEGE